MEAAEELIFAGYLPPQFQTELTSDFVLIGSASASLTLPVRMSQPGSEAYLIEVR